MRRVALLACVVVVCAACGDNIHPVGEGDSIDTVAPAQVTAGDVISVTCNLTSGNQTMPTDMATIDVVAEDDVSHVGDEIIARTVGTITVTCGIPDLDLVDPTPAVVKILPGPPASLVTAITPTPATAGDTVNATCLVYDSSGNELDGFLPTLTIAPSDPGNTITNLSALMTVSGHYDGECALPGATSNDVGFDVMPNLPAALVLGKLPDEPFYQTDTAIQITSVVTDRYGNQVPNATVDVTSMAITGTGAITSPGPSTFSYGGDGKYEVDGTVSGATDGNQPVTASTDIFIDSLGPRITCGSPGDGTMIEIANGGTLTFQGVASAANGAASVTINGNNASFNSTTGAYSGSFVTRFGINFAEVTATDTLGVDNTKICTFLASSSYADPNSPLGGTIGLSLAQGAIDDGNRAGLPSSINSLGDLLYVILNSAGIRSTIDTALKAENPLASGCFGGTLFGDCIGVSYSITYNSSSIDGPNTVSLTLQSTGLGTSATINGVHLNLTLGGFGVSGNVNIASISIGLTLVPSVSGGAPTVTVTNVSAGVGSITTNFQCGGFFCSLWADFINDIVVPLAEGTLKSEVQNLVQNFITNSFGTAIGGLLSGLNISSLASTFNVPRLYGGGTVPLNFGVAFSSIDTNTARLRFGIGTKLTSTLANAYGTLGVAIPPGALLGDPNPAPGDMAVGVNAVMLNQALHALWRANYVTATIMATTINASAPADLALQLSARLPPVADVKADGSVEIALGDIDLALTGSEVPPGLVITIGGLAHTTVNVSGTTLQFGAVSLDKLEVSLDDLGLSSSSQTELQQLIASALPQLLQGSLSNALPSFPIPSFPIPASLSTYGIPAGSTLSILSPSLQTATPELILRGQFGIGQ
ncbi:MAG TPA: hypothetical protein VGG74_15075 [Kofleriaceae bacterium]